MLHQATQSTKYYIHIFNMFPCKIGSWKQNINVSWLKLGKDVHGLNIDKVSDLEHWTDM